MKNIAIFASGRGSNAEKIIQYLEKNNAIQVALIVSNKKKAGVLDVARRYGIPSLVIDRPAFYQTKDLLLHLQEYKIDLVVLAGFLWLIPEYLIEGMEGRIVNIHPALLPKFGGKGMYGRYVHEAVLNAGEKESGVTIHWVNSQYDEGQTIFQASCPVDPADSPETLARKVQVLEHRYYPAVIRALLEPAPAGSHASEAAGLS